MDRLTKRVGDKSIDVTSKYFDLTHEELVHELFNRLAKYEDLEEQGGLLVLPFKRGDEIYDISHNELRTYVIESPLNVNIGVEENEKYNPMLASFNLIESLGTTIFLDSEEAKEKLETMNKGGKEIDD